MTAFTIADRLKGVESSPTLALAAKAKALAAAGQRVVNFTAGEPDFPTPELVKRAGIAAIERNETRYTPAAGLPQLREAIAQDLGKRLGVAYRPEQVIVSCGAKHALYNALQVICQPGDEVVVLSPYWVSYPPLVRLAGAAPVIVETSAGAHFQPDVDAVADAVTSRTRALMLNSPSNPTGVVIEPERLSALAGLARAKELIIISDEIYDQLVYPPHHACSVVQAAPEEAERTIVVNGVSKTYSMTGWRIGYAAAPQPVVDAMTRLQSHSTSNPTSISQHAALAALAASDPGGQSRGGIEAEVAAMREEFARRRDQLVAGLNRLDGCHVETPHGAFYAWCQVSDLGESAGALAARWLEEALVATVPGEGFGSSSHIRFSFATSMEAIAEGVTRLEQWVKEHR